MNTLAQWRERCTDQTHCWMVLRLIHCKLNWLTVEGTWTKKQMEAAAWTGREQAYQAARDSSGLLYSYDR